MFVVSRASTDRARRLRSTLAAAASAGILLAVAGCGSHANSSHADDAGDSAPSCGEQVEYEGFAYLADHREPRPTSVEELGLATIPHCGDSPRSGETVRVYRITGIDTGTRIYSPDAYGGTVLNRTGPPDPAR
ncbi:DUF6281 family protein [Marmoricola sp. RAF53]|uniref:DUF6281 family protein n=1 Tax=Marmoricola sp. RAF53 TaxID=3233059 RepID=UPI003F98E7E7